LRPTHMFLVIDYVHLNVFHVVNVLHVVILNNSATPTTW